METHPAIAREAGPLLPFLLDPQIREIRCTSAGRVFTIHSEHGKQRQADYDPQLLDGFLMLIAHEVGGAWKATEPRLHAADPKLGIRIQASRPPVSPASQMTLRKHPNKVFPLKDWVDKGILTAQQKEALEQLVLTRQTIVFSGAMGSGKTSLQNACIDVLRESQERMVIVEDDPEAICTMEDVEFQRVVRALDGQEAVSLHALCLDALRMSADRFVVQELRGPEALPALQLFQTGHPGMCTVHAPSARSTLLRLEQLVQLTSVDPQRRLIAEAVNAICHMEQHGRLWKMTALLRVDPELDAHGNYYTSSLVEE
jgi:type IV secretion system protein VirB11